MSQFSNILCGLATVFLCLPFSLTAEDSASVVEILKTREWTADGKTPSGTIWRGFQVWKNDVVLMDDGTLVEVDPRTPLSGIKKKSGEAVEIDQSVADYTLRNFCKGLEKILINPARHVIDTQNPPDNWQAVDFDDAEWIRDAFPQRELYSLTKMRCLRGTFTVSDAGQAGDLKLRFRYRGGAVVYLNGKEIGRGHLPQGAITVETLADPYENDAYIDVNNQLISQGFGWHGKHPNQGPPHSTALYSMKKEVGLTYRLGRSSSISYDNAHELWFRSKDPDVVKKYQSRTRSLEISIKANQLQKGVNVLALAVHRAPAWSGMFINGASNTTGQLATKWWDRCEIEDILLTGESSEGIVPNVVAPDTLTVFNHPTNVSLSPAFFADSNEKLRPVQVFGARNGTYAGQLVVAGKSIHGLKVSVGAMKGPGTFSRDQIEIGYPVINHLGKQVGSYFDNIETAPEATIEKVVASGDRVFKAMQPIWFSVKIPVDAAPGLYTAPITVEADGLKITTPLEVHVTGTWQVPSTKDFNTVGVFLESPDSLANHYDLKMWSKEHWTMIEKTFEVMAQAGNKAVFIPLISKTHLGNEHSMVYWIKQSDGSYKVDLRIAEKYLDLAIKHFGDLRIICLWTGTGYTNKDRNPRVTVADPQTGALTEMRPPKWGEEGSVEFWQPVIDQCKAMIAKRGQAATAVQFGLLGDKTGPDFQDIHATSPDTKWIASTHVICRSWKGKTKDGEKLKGEDFMGSWSWMHGYLFRGVTWMDDSDGPPVYAWRERDDDQGQVPALRLASTRSRTALLNNDNNADLNRLSIAMESLNLSRCGGYTFQGYGLWGADMWHTEMHKYDNHHRTGMDQNTFRWLAAPGKSGPVSTCRARNLQMSQQEAELRMYVQDAIVDPELSKRLSADLIKRSKAVCDERSKMLSFIARYRYNSKPDSMPKTRMVPDITVWKNSTIELYKLAGEINAILGKVK